MKKKKYLALLLCLIITISFPLGSSAFILNNNYNAMGFNSYSEYLKTLSSQDSVTIAVIDSGVSEIESLSGRLINGTSLITHDDETLGQTEDNTHGTFIASLIADITSGLPINIMPIKVMMNKTTSINQIAEGIRYAVDNGADVINISINGEANQCTALDEAIEYADDNNVVVVVAAGNDKEELTKYNCPSHNQSTIVVSSVDENCLFAKDFSNYGVNVDCCAPGKYINGYNEEGNRVYKSGTSFSAAFISAGAAMMELQFPEFSDEEIQTKLKTICNDIYPYGKDKYYGYGLPDFSKLIPAECSIRKYCTELNVDYRSKITLHADVDMPFKYIVKWYIDGSYYSSGDTITIERITSTSEILFTAESQEGLCISSKKEIIKVDSSFFCKLSSVFRMFFGVLPNYIDNTKTN